MSQERIDAIRERLQAASPGPWRLEHRMIDAGPDDDERCGLGWDWDEETQPPEPMRGVFARAADAKFVANAHEDIAFLLDELSKGHAAAMRYKREAVSLAVVLDIGDTLQRLKRALGCAISIEPHLRAELVAQGFPEVETL